MWNIIGLWWHLNSLPFLTPSGYRLLVSSLGGEGIGARSVGASRTPSRCTPVHNFQFEEIQILWYKMGLLFRSTAKSLGVLNLNSSAIVHRIQSFLVTWWASRHVAGRACCSCTVSTPSEKQEYTALRLQQCKRTTWSPCGAGLHMRCTTIVVFFHVAAIRDSTKTYIEATAEHEGSLLSCTFSCLLTLNSLCFLASCHYCIFVPSARVPSRKIYI